VWQAGEPDPHHSIREYGGSTSGRNRATGGGLIGAGIQSLGTGTVSFSSLTSRPSGRGAKPPRRPPLGSRPQAAARNVGRCRDATTTLRVDLCPEPARFAPGVNRALTGRKGGVDGPPRWSRCQTRRPCPSEPAPRRTGNGGIIE
jgi:hypothetical protein